MPSIVPALPDICGNTEIVLAPGGWHALEVESGRCFRWVDNDAAFELPPALNPFAEIELEVCAGPGMGRQHFQLTVRGDAFEQAVAVHDEQRLTLSLPLSRHCKSLFTLHADGGGLPCPNDDRNLNFRVFRLATLPNIVSIQAGVDLVSGWNRFGEDPPARVANSGACIRVHSHRDFPVLCLDLHPAGPANRAGIRIDLLDEDGAPVSTTAIQSRELVGMRLPLRAGMSKVFSLYLEWIGGAVDSPPAVVAFLLRLN